METQAPGGVYMCQLDQGVSCGACCGLYNINDASYASIHLMLEKRTLAFQNVERKVDAIDAFGEWAYSDNCADRPLPRFHHCPYLGLIGDDLDRVGCLLHPLGKGNNKTDWRGLSYYGGLACNTYFCPTHNKTKAIFKKTVQNAVLNEAVNNKNPAGWYLYGLIITENDLLNAILTHIENKAGRCITHDDISGNLPFLSNVYKLLNLKLTWPYRKNRIFVHYFFNDGQYKRESIDYQAITCTVSRYDVIFKHLCSKFENKEQLNEAEFFMEKHVNDAAESLIAFTHNNNSYR